MLCIGNAATLGDPPDWQVGCFQQEAGVFSPALEQAMQGRCAKSLAEQAVEVSLRPSGRSRNLFKADWLAEMIVNELGRCCCGIVLRQGV